MFIRCDGEVFGESAEHLLASIRIRFNSAKGFVGVDEDDILSVINKSDGIRLLALEGTNVEKLKKRMISRVNNEVKKGEYTRINALVNLELGEDGTFDFYTEIEETLRSELSKYDPRTEILVNACYREEKITRISILLCYNKE